ncbi:hypothetical protein BJX61DRAFT_534977 [Aspergillus egyptiacus]|nr:hypothetical protein BJX61DRAFT_534977 [Aspergillus egyptiacus]
MRDPDMAATKEKVLSLDLAANDFLYRIRRDKRVVYVSVLDGDIIPPDFRTDSYRILQKLRSVPRWNEEWKTSTIRKTPDGIDSIPNELQPHGSIWDGLMLVVSRISDRIARVSCDGGTCILKVARFAHEIQYLQQEVSVYSTLTSSGFPLSPRFIGYVYEETKCRTVGFLLEETIGTPPDILNLGDCMKTIQLLMTDKGAQVSDFEVSTVHGDVDPTSAEEELRQAER